MPQYIKRTWNPGHKTLGLSRRDLKPGEYLAYVPDELSPQLPQLSAAATAAATDALATLARADERIGSRARFLSHLLIRSESISSSWIEGNRITPKRLAIAEQLQVGNRTALAVIANVRATETAIASLADPHRKVTVADLIDLQHAIEPKLRPGLREEQNWVGGAGWSPLRAEFIPPPEWEVPRLMQNLAEYLTETSGNPIIRAAIAHAQFETIHPFLDGNGRTGRALIHTVLKRADALRHTLIPISTVFAGRADAYIAGLNAFRKQPPALEDWVISFSQATEHAAIAALQLADEVTELDRRIQEQLIAYRASLGKAPARPRADALVWRILQVLAQEPVLTVDFVKQQLDTSATAAHRALTELATAHILKISKDHKGKVQGWTADSYLDLVTLADQRNRAGGAW